MQKTTSLPRQNTLLTRPRATTIADGSNINQSASTLTVNDVNRSRISRSTECLPSTNFDSFDEDYKDLNSCMMLPESASLDDIVLNSQRAMMRNDQRKRSILKNRITKHFKDLKCNF